MSLSVLSTSLTRASLSRLAYAIFMIATMLPNFNAFIVSPLVEQDSVFISCNSDEIVQIVFYDYHIYPSDFLIRSVRRSNYLGYTIVYLMLLLALNLCMLRSHLLLPQQLLLLLWSLCTWYAHSFSLV